MNEVLAEMWITAMVFLLGGFAVGVVVGIGIGRSQ